MTRRKIGWLLAVAGIATAYAGWQYRREGIGYYHAWCGLYRHGESAEYHREQLLALGEPAWPALRWWLELQQSGAVGVSPPSQADKASAADTLLARWLITLAENDHLPAILQRLVRDWPNLSEFTQAALLQALYMCSRAGASESAGNVTMPAMRPLATPQSVSITPETVRGFLQQVQPLTNHRGRLAAVRLSHWASLSESSTASQSSSDHFADWWHWCRELAELALTDEREEVRLEAIRLAALPQLQLRQKLARRLLEPPGEPSPSARVLLLIAVGDAQSEDVAPSESLARLLHDESPEVRRTCEQVLRTRGLTPRQIQLARMWTDADPLVRIRVPSLVYQENDLDPVAWLERLSRDPSAAVRAAVVRAAGERKEVRFAARVAEMAQDDPSPTVRQLASYYQREIFARQP